MTVYFNSSLSAVSAQGFVLGPESFIETRKRIAHKDIFIVPEDGSPLEPTVVSPKQPEMPEVSREEGAPQLTRWQRFKLWLRG